MKRIGQVEVDHIPGTGRKPETHPDDDLERAIAEAWARVDAWLSRPRDQAEATIVIVRQPSATAVHALLVEGVAR